MKLTVINNATEIMRVIFCKTDIRTHHHPYLPCPFLWRMFSFIGFVQSHAFEVGPINQLLATSIYFYFWLLFYKCLDMII